MRYKRSSIIIIRVYSTYIGAVRLREGIRDGSRHEDFVNTHIYIRRRGCGVPGFFWGGGGTRESDMAHCILCNNNDIYDIVYICVEAAVSIELYAYTTRHPSPIKFTVSRFRVVIDADGRLLQVVV